MRLWHYKLIPVLPNKMLISQWRECIAIMRQWKNGTLKHRLVSYVKDYDKGYFKTYVILILLEEMQNRNINYSSDFYYEFLDFCENCNLAEFKYYPEHNDRYLAQCCFNLQEKYDRGIISEEEWNKIEPVLFKIEIHKTISKEEK